VTHYAVVREDLPRNVLGLVLFHAGGESSDGTLDQETHGVVLAAANERALEQEAQRLRALGIDFVEIREDRPPWNGALMALGVRPGRKEVLRRAFSSMRLLRE
jgi:hypothetical protein